MYYLIFHAVEHIITKISVLIRIREKIENNTMSEKIDLYLCSIDTTFPKNV